MEVLVHISKDEDEQAELENNHIVERKVNDQSTYDRFLIVCRQHPRKIAACFLFCSFLFVFFMVIFGPCVIPTRYTSKTPLTTKAPSNLSSIKVIVLGDSLVMGSAYEIFSMVNARVKTLLPNFDVELLNFGEGGAGILTMRSKLPEIYKTHADAVILLWDSDEYILPEEVSDETLNRLRPMYTSNVTYVVRAIQANKPAVKIALAGPIIVGDGPWNVKKTIEEYRLKARVFDIYREINRQLSGQLNATYIDLRQAYLDAVPPAHLGSRNCVTVDGNHPSENGAMINARKIAETLHDWFL